ncbi:MAG TPA: YvrJ family protein [Atopostipes sp.]|nr:YvrJ family protein [Atopostipes sp.]
MELNLELLTGLTDIIANIGFPMFVAMFLLNRMEIKIDHIIDALHQLTKVIADEK